MQTILQLSDFHITESMPLPEKNIVFKSMTESLERLNLENIILVYNGDVIDSKVIKDKIDDALPLAEKARLWDYAAERAYRLAKKYFDFLSKRLSIANDRIIICCGNHDINPYYEGIEQISCPNTGKSVLYNQKRFEQFSKFCDQIQLRRNTWGTYFREIDSINILVVNSNWIDKWGPSGRRNLCIACNQIGEQIRNKAERLARTKRDRSKLCNIFVAHAPRADYCEESIYRYEDNDQSPIMDLVDRHFGLKLYGDKHTDNVHKYDYIVGAPLGSDFISCGIHQFDNEYHHHHKSLVLSQKIWRLVGSDGDIEEILNISVDSIKAQALEYLFASRDASDLALKVKSFEEVRSGDNWALLDKLIRSCADIQKPQSGSAGIPIDASDGFINTLTRLISDSTNRVSITLRGDERVGKSVCMSVLYLNLLHSFLCGTFEYMPVYINVEQIMSQLGGDNRDSQACTKKLRGILAEKLSRGIELATKLQRPACCLIDGINRYYIYKKARIEAMIADEIESTVGKKYSHIVYCIDSGNNTGLGSTPQHTKKDAEYIVYFNRILTKKVNSKKKYRTFVKAYCALRDASSADQTSKIVLKNIENMRILEVDTSLLTNFWDRLRTEKGDSFFEVIDYFVNQHIENGQMANAAKACFMYYNKGKCYTDIKKECKISNSTFELIRTQKLAARYLLAANYVLSIQNLGKKIEADSCLNVLYNHEICAFIRQYICKYDAQTQIMAFAKDQYENLSFEGKATISFLVGRIECKKEEVVEILDIQDKCVNCIEVDGPDVVKFHKSIAQRSVRLSRMFTESDPCACIRDYIHKLISDSYERRINRVFYLQFYGDRSADLEDYISEGFDIYYTYNILASRLETWKKESKWYTLLDLEIFTLCDLLQIRLDQALARSSGKKEYLNSFFYHEKFNQPNDDMAINVLKFMTEIISTYLEQYGNIDDNLIFNKYLAMQKKSFEVAINKLEKGPLNSGQDAFAPGELFAKLRMLGIEKRIGWEIPDTLSGSINHEQYMQLRMSESVHETTMQHTFEAYLIGLLYLPGESQASKSYDKQKILNALLVHDLGEARVGDIIPAYEYYEKSREQEREFCEELFLQGTRSNIADLSEYLLLWEAWCDNSNDDYNIVIAKEIDKIQMLYKMLLLLSTKKINLTAGRIKDFWKSKNYIKSVEGKSIFNILIARDPVLKMVAEQYHLIVSELK